MILEDIQFKDVKMFQDFYQFGHKYTKIRHNWCEETRTRERAMCDPDNWVQIDKDDK